MSEERDSKLSSTRSQWICTVGKVFQLDEAINQGHLKGVFAPRFALVGRSNVGKSTLLNALAGSALAQISKQPGKTRLLHFYNVPKLGIVLADLPGYGYARVDKKQQEEWKQLITAYVKKDSRLGGVLLLWDARHGPTAQDQDAYQYFNSLGISVIIVMTKWDAVKTQVDRARRKKELAKALGELGLEDSKLLWVSVKSKIGVNELENVLASLAN